MNFLPVINTTKFVHKQIFLFSLNQTSRKFILIANQFKLVHKSNLVQANLYSASAATSAVIRAKKEYPNRLETEIDHEIITELVKILNITIHIKSERSTDNNNNTSKVLNDRTQTPTDPYKKPTKETLILVKERFVANVTYLIKNLMNS